jgi:Protein of Unknown function (DUF2784)
MESQAFYAASADAIVAVHTLFVGFVVVGQLLILIGLVCRWKWVRNPWFRVVHLLCIGIVAAEAASGVICPLTLWERELRDLSGQTVNDSAIGWFFNSILFFNMPREFFVWIHISFGAIVLGTFVFGLPRFRRQATVPALPRRAASSMPAVRPAGINSAARQAQAQ